MIKKHSKLKNEMKNEFSVLRCIISGRFRSSFDSLLYIRTLINILFNIYLFKFKYSQSLTKVKVHFGYQSFQILVFWAKYFPEKHSSCFKKLNYFPAPLTKNLSSPPPHLLKIKGLISIYFTLNSHEQLSLL